MKKHFTLAFAFAALATYSSYAQQGFHIGATTAYNYTLILDKGLFDGSTYNHQTTFRAAPIGLALGYQWESDGTRNGIQLEVIKARIGQELDINTRDASGQNFITTGKKEINLDYIQVPLLFKLASGEGKTKFTFHIGPQISFLQKAEDVETFNTSPIRYTDTNSPVTVTTGKEYLIGSTEETARYTFNDLALGGVAGLGVDYFVTDNIYLSGSIRAGYNFTEIREEPESAPKFVDTNYNTGAQADPESTLYIRELRTAGYAGLQLGVHYFFGQENKD